jgi:hypothetical protein
MAESGCGQGFGGFSPCLGFPINGGVFGDRSSVWVSLTRYAFCKPTASVGNANEVSNAFSGVLLEKLSYTQTPLI